MAERRIEELPLIVDPNGSTAFPVEQDGVAKRMSLQGMRDYVFEHGADTVVVTFANFQASMTSSEIFAQANLGRNIVLRMQDENVHYDAPLAMASENYCLFAKNSANATNTYQIDSNGTVTITNNIYIRSNASDTIGGNYRLNLNYTPDGDKNAVNKKYVDDFVNDYVDNYVSGYVSNAISAALNTIVKSVNGETGDVVIPEVEFSLERTEFYTNYTIAYGSEQITVRVPIETPQIFEFSYSHDTEIANTDYTAIENALTNGQIVVCNVVSGASNFKAYLTRYCEGQSDEESYFSFDFVTAQTAGSNLGLLYGSLKVYGDDSREYKEGTITHQELQS